MTELDLWLLPLLMALLVGVLCPVTGTLLVTQRRVLQANLISHAVLPGVALAVALGVDPAIGGVLSGLLGSLLAERLQRGQLAGQEAVINTVLAGFLGLGVLLIPLLNLRLDLEGLLFGDLLIVDWSDLTRVLVAASAMALLLLTRYRQLVFLGVDPEGAQAAGLPVRSLQLIQALVTSMVIVSAMAAVGVILVIGLLCAPVLPGLRRVGSLRAAMVQSAFVGLALSAIGFLLAVPLNLPPGHLIGVACMALLCLPKLKLAA
ncbi:ABC-type Mn2+/Zn2+ transport system/ permease component [Synechococcus sp. MEDNS5]|uniref:metal ABC transporter permease n=1 Tax=Synechococcus sp. MEDNS5 TaxID=1442554 RepID=UPI001648A5E8|nr:metal ABC transporter permease [Synechococcus sp. MEDNS5]QNJ05763.1 ABC-type Mn2+/Zn2+ transport system/ permease component [Synechococcus sp. MEDNS5]